MQRLPAKKVIAWRFFTGAHLDGRRRTNATWFREGTSPKYLCNWWNRKPRFYRAMWRVVPLALVILELVALQKGLTFGLNMIAAPLVAAFLWEKFKPGSTIAPRKVGVNLGERSDKERDIIDEIGMDEVEEDRSATVRNIRKNRKAN